MRKLVVALQIVFGLVLIGMVIHHKSNHPRILILHSYHAQYSWVDEQNQGLAQYFQDKHDISLRWHYMDLKRHSDNAFRQAASASAQAAIARWQPDVLIIFDDIAQELVGKRYRNRPHIRIVFAGVNSQPSKYQYDTANNVTGILERKPLRALEETLQQLAPHIRRPRVQLIGDASFDFAASLPEYADYQTRWRSVQWLPPQTASTFAGWQAAVQGATGQADFIVVSDYRQLQITPGQPQFVAPEEVMRWTEQHAPMPVIGLTTAAVQDGAMLGVATSGHEQGWVAAELAFKLAHGEPAHAWPIRVSQQSHIALRQSAMARWHLPAPVLYQAFAKEKNLLFD